MPLAQVIGDLVETAIGDGIFPGAEILLARGDEILMHKAWGSLGTSPDLPLETGMVHDLASLTKPIATATLLLLLHDQGALSLDDKARYYLPALSGPETTEITLRQLAAHSAGFPASIPFYDMFTSAKAAWEHLHTASLLHPPGSAVLYSCLGYLVLGEIIETVSGTDLDHLFARKISTPLGLASTGFRPLAHGITPERIVPSASKRAGRHLLRGSVHDSSCARFGGICGNAGLFSTAPDILAYARMVLGYPPYVLSHEARAAMMANQSPPGQIARSIGWEINLPGSDASCGAGFPHGAIGHTGFTGTSLWIDPQTQTTVITLANRTMATLAADAAPLRAFRRQLHRLAIAAH